MLVVKIALIVVNMARVSVVQMIHNVVHLRLVWYFVADQIHIVAPVAAVVKV